MNENESIRDVICVNTTTSDRPPPQPRESSSLPNAGSLDERAGWSVVTRGRVETSAITSAKRTQASGRQLRPTLTDSFEAATTTAKKAKAEESTAKQIV